ncbi:hypothetical protein QJV45_14365 [Listeria booriae]|uniref:hypothetical protein n=1 Tax=Listeria booriae TaxID=1552123 RepID=UPI0028807079|nr:hypothetical protein [Listeria booriae]MDT0111664.1 hypothetical protein [Listeria booriae]
MQLLGKKQRLGGKEKKKSKPVKAKKRKNIRKKKVFKNPSDVRLFYVMPVLLLIGVICVISGFVILHHNSTVYTDKVLASSMKKGEELVKRNQDSEGTLTLGNTVLSADEKTLAVEIKYDEAAHSQLSAFGDNYKIFVISTKDNRMNKVSVKYGMFGTDGSGVLTIYKKDGFKNRAFKVYIMDKEQLVSSDDLQDSRTLTDSEIESSIESQLAAADTETSTDGEKPKDKLPPTYIVRLNAHSAEVSYRNWWNDKELIEDLFVDRNLKKIEKNKNDLVKKIEKGKASLEEMDKRLKKNPNDSTALSNKQTLENSLENLDVALKKEESDFTRISQSHIDTHVLDPKQTKYQYYEVNDINKSDD